MDIFTNTQRIPISDAVDENQGSDLSTAAADVGSILTVSTPDTVVGEEKGRKGQQLAKTANFNKMDFRQLQDHG